MTFAKLAREAPCNKVILRMHPLSSRTTFGVHKGMLYDPLACGLASRSREIDVPHHGTGKPEAARHSDIAGNRFPVLGCYFFACACLRLFTDVDLRALVAG